jgi:hypothetical protein
MHPGKHKKAAGPCYVMLTRITDLNNLCIPASVAFDRITTKIKQHKGLVKRVQKEDRLAILEAVIFKKNIITIYLIANLTEL